ncbi:MAG: response regulator [Candidatus Methanomethylicaceae archaeon]|jgi:DNA-binding NtrC family response regulator
MSAEKKKILLIDDDENILSTLKSYLLRIGYAVETAKNGKEALEASANQYFNVAVVDLVLPDIPGTQLLVRMHSGTPRMRKIILTGHATMDNAIETLNLGADTYLMKPVNPKELLRVIEEQLAKQQEDTTVTEEKMSDFIDTKIKLRDQERTV